MRKSSLILHKFTEHYQKFPDVSSTAVTHADRAENPKDNVKLSQNLWVHGYTDDK